MKTPKKIIVIGAGSRGAGYSKYIEQYPEKAQIIAVAEPRDEYRNALAKIHNIPEDMCFRSWEEITARPKFADAVFICTQDQMHEDVAIKCANLKYNILLEKPMAPTAQACINIVNAVKENGVIFAVCHVLRYTRYSEIIRDILDKKTIGDIVSIQHLEPVGYWHQAHSFVRGNWRNSQEASFMLLQKCCHDLDWLRMIMKDNCKQIQSFGSLKYFNKENQPKNAANRCMDCPKDVESNCPYSALKIYIKDRVDKDMLHWPVNVLVKDVTKEKVLDAIAKGPYGRCVFACDNDVVDNQVVNMEFANGSTVSMTMTAFAGKSGRQTKIFGTRGIAIGDDKSWQVYDYLSDKETSFDADLNADGSILSGHGGGDYHLIANFLDALLENDQSKILSGADESLESHLMVFAAEKSRLENKIINMNEFKR